MLSLTLTTPHSIPLSLPSFPSPLPCSSLCMQFGGTDLLHVYNTTQVKTRLSTNGMYICNTRVRGSRPAGAAGRVQQACIVRLYCMCLRMCVHGFELHASSETAPLPSSSPFRHPPPLLPLSPSSPPSFPILLPLLLLLLPSSLPTV